MKRNSYIYFAGPDVFRPNYNEYFEHVAKYINKRGLVGIFPTDGPMKTAKGIYSENIHSIHVCDFVLANLDPFHGASLDVGTAFEMGYAKALGKRVVGYYTNHMDKELKKRVTRKYRNCKYTSVEDFGLTDNLMIITPCEYIGNSIYDAVDYVYKRLND